MKKIFSIALFSIAGLLLASCAEDHQTDTSEFQQGIFDRWMEKYHPEATRLDGKYKGLYVEWLEQDAEAMKPRNGYWIKLNYTAQDQDGNIFLTRSPETAKRMGFFPKNDRLHYFPELIEYDPATLSYSGNYALGQILALSMMGVEDSLRVYMPSYMGFTGYYGFSYSGERHYGYSASHVSIPANAALIYDMKITEVIKDIHLYETELVQQFARDTLGITNMTDTLATGAYMKKYIVNEEGDSVKEKSTAYVYYTGRYLDGYVFDTNVDSVAKANGIKNISGEPAEWDLAKTTFDVAAFKMALLNMQAGEHARVVLVSGLGYGENGNTVSDYYGTSNLTIPGYTPLEFSIHVEKVEYPKEDDDDDDDDGD